MSAKEPKNVVASVLERLRNESKSTGAPFQQVLQQYAIERLLHRISKSKHANGVVLKGALLLKTIGIPNARPTMDIDMLRQGKADHATLVALVKDCATLEVDPDGLDTRPASRAEGCSSEDLVLGTASIEVKQGVSAIPKRLRLLDAHSALAAMTTGVALVKPFAPASCESAHAPPRRTPHLSQQSPRVVAI